MKIHESTTSCVNTPTQHAALAALTGPQGPVVEMQAAFRERRGYVLDRIDAIPGVSAAWPEGAFYAFVDVNAVIHRPVGGPLPGLEFQPATERVGHRVESGGKRRTESVRPVSDGQERREQSRSRPRRAARGEAGGGALDPGLVYSEYSE